MKHFNYGIDDVIMCEACEEKVAKDIHHIDNKGMGGSKEKDYIENLAALCRTCHEHAHNDPGFNFMVKELHLKKL